MGLVLVGFLAVYPGARDEALIQRSRKCGALECFEGPCQIPAKLLTGPWTDDGKLHFLEALLDPGARIINDDHEKLTEQGLMDAIKKTTIAQSIFWRPGLLMLSTRIRMTPRHL